MFADSLWTKIGDFFLSSRFFASALIVAAAAVAVALLSKAVGVVLKKHNVNAKQNTGIRVLISTVRTLIIVIAALTVLQINGVNVTSLVAGLGIAGIVVGFALQDILKDLIMGVTILWDHFFDIGDVVRYGDTVGKVVSYNLKTTKLQVLATNNLLTVSNRNISEMEVLSDWMDLSVPIPYNQPAAKAQALCSVMAERIGALEGARGCESLGLKEFGDSQIFYLLRVHAAPEVQGQLRRDAHAVIQTVLEENGIAIPFSRLDVHLNNASQPQ